MADELVGKGKYKITHIGIGFCRQSNRKREKKFPSKKERAKEPARGSYRRSRSTSTR